MMKNMIKKVFILFFGILVTFLINSINKVYASDLSREELRNYGINENSYTSYELFLDKNKFEGYTGYKYIYDENPKWEDGQTEKEVRYFFTKNIFNSIYIGTLTAKHTKGYETEISYEIGNIISKNTSKQISGKLGADINDSVGVNVTIYNLEGYTKESKKSSKETPTAHSNDETRMITINASIKVEEIYVFTYIVHRTPIYKACTKKIEGYRYYNTIDMDKCIDSYVLSTDKIFFN